MRFHCSLWEEGMVYCFEFQTPLFCSRKPAWLVGSVEHKEYGVVHRPNAICFNPLHHHHSRLSHITWLSHLVLFALLCFMRESFDPPPFQKITMNSLRWDRLTSSPFVPFFDQTRPKSQLLHAYPKAPRIAQCRSWKYRRLKTLLLGYVLRVFTWAILPLPFQSNLVPWTFGKTPRRLTLNPFTLTVIYHLWWLTL